MKKLNLNLVIYHLTVAADTKLKMKMIMTVKIKFLINSK